MESAEQKADRQEKLNRLRGLLNEMEHRQASHRPVGAHDAAFDTGDVEAHWQKRDTSCTGSSFGSTRTERIVWANSVSGEEGDLEVPRSVARSFDERPRRFESFGDLEEYIAQLEQDCALEQVTSWLRARERSTGDIRRRLLDAGYSPASTAFATKRATELGILNDSRFAETFILAKSRAGWGRKRIEDELGRDGVDLSSVPGYPEAFFSNESEEERARALLAKKSVPMRDPVPKLARFLAGKGFPSSLALRLARERVQDV